MRILTSSKYQMAILTLASLLLADFFGVNLSPEQLAAVALPVLAAIAGTAYEDSRKEEIELVLTDDSEE
jgi:hypothetical protein